MAVKVVGREELESIYGALNRREYVHPDPLEFLYRYDDPLDREVAGMVAASLAYGRVRQILASVEKALGVLGASPAGFLADATPERLDDLYSGFKHRFTTGDELARLLASVGAVQRSHGSLGAGFADLIGPRDETVVPALERFAGTLRGDMWCGNSSVLPAPEKGSACKRLHLFLRWMVRQDEVDPGGWADVPASKLVVPLDTHMHRISRALGFTARAQADLRTALEITRAFHEFAPDDPVKYDFALTRLGIRDDVTLESVLSGAVTGLA
ncbi:MAG: TIGR02757 family protein [Candidatus Eisenbacteria bacterium]|nr:TIGR02757 family protein [Candidatus Eisenbacteria bacterium]